LTKAREGHLRRLYGITLEQYDELLARQDNKCPVCLKHESEFTIKLAVDHDHKSGEVRGLLCNYCNHRMVGRHRDPALLRRIADYLEVGTGWFVPPKKKTRRRKTPRKVKDIGKTTRPKRPPARHRVATD
jgi:hypothetical protein